LKTHPNLNFCFKGQRNYVHGTDIIAQLITHLSNYELTALDVKFNGIVSTNLALIIGHKSAAAKVKLRCKLDQVPTEIQLVENGEIIQCRYEYDESQIIQHTQLDLAQQQISLQAITGFTICENFVAMNKYLFQHLFPEAQGKWYFTRLEQTHVIQNDALITVKLVKNFNFRLTKSNILLNGAIIGSVYFTLVKP